MIEPDEQRRTISMLGVPAALFVDLVAHMQDLVRELELVTLDDRSPDGIPDELRHLTGDLVEQYGARWAVAVEQAAAAERAGREHVDFDVALDHDASKATEELFVLAEQADELARAGLLLTQETRADIAALRRWIVEEVQRQLVYGMEPTTYPG